jgi:hypothetical protein
MEITIKGEAKEIAALVSLLQERQSAPSETAQPAKKMSKPYGTGCIEYVTAEERVMVEFDFPKDFIGELEAFQFKASNLQ